MGSDAYYYYLFMTTNPPYMAGQPELLPSVDLSVMTTNPPHVAGQPELLPSVDLASYEGILCFFFIPEI